MGDMTPAEARNAQAGGSVAGTSRAVAEHARTTGLDRVDQSIAVGPISVTLSPEVESAIEADAPHEELAEAIAFVGSGDKLIPTAVRGAIVTVTQ